MKSEENIRIQSISDERMKPTRCCLCMDVRLATVLIGLFCMAVNAAGFIASTTVMLKNKEKLGEWKYFSNVKQASTSHAVDQLIGLSVTSICFVIIIALVYGAIKRKSNYILPFFCLQVFDATVTLMVAATMISYAPQVKYFIENHPEVYMSADCISHMSVEKFRYFLVLFWLVMLTAKYFMMTVVWSCYKYCKSFEERQSLVQLPQMLYHGNMDTVTNLPSYEDVVKIAPPPAYSS
ncbi:lysosomal-associated transmembrane protein 4B isoform X1 [Hydra vulgaris]|nr:lysosomal-associated transmembrane protein 4B [Hydra vulgaris]